MPDLTIKNVPDAIAQALRRRADGNHRSLHGELMVILQQAVSQTSWAQPLTTLQVTGEQTGRRTIEEIAEARRARYPEPIRIGPLAVDVIRAHRDGA